MNPAPKVETLKMSERQTEQQLSTLSVQFLIRILTVTRTQRAYYFRKWSGSLLGMPNPTNHRRVRSQRDLGQIEARKRRRGSLYVSWFYIEDNQKYGLNQTVCHRFERTADMLAKSGLLEITMKTADLIRSNQQAQRELEQLKVFSLFYLEKDFLPNT